MKLKKIFHWEYVERTLRIIEVSAIVVASFIIFQIPHQIKEWENARGERSLNVLFQLETKLISAKNREIYNSIEKNKPLLTENKGKFSTEDLDFYLNDIMSIVDAKDRNLIDLKDIYDWFSNYFIKTYHNTVVSQC
jgi:hypothetical protein